MFVPRINHLLECCDLEDELYLQGNMLSGDLDIVLCPDGSPLTGKFLADCAPPDAEVTCTCCTACCNDSSDRCTLS